MTDSLSASAPACRAELHYDSQHPPLAALACVSAVEQSNLASLVSVKPYTASSTPNQATVAAGQPQSTVYVVDLQSKQQFHSELAVARYLARLHDAHSTDSDFQLYGSSVLQSSQIDFFLDMSHLLDDKDHLTTHASSLNTHLRSRTTLVGQSVTVADLCVYSSLHANPRWLNFLKSPAAASHAHLIRWHSFLSHHALLTSSQSALKSAATQSADAKLASSRGGSYEIDMGPDAASMQGRVVTRFPPEPSGYMHLGHAKAALLNDYIAKSYAGKLILRFDDTNSVKEKEEYVHGILSDLKLLGVNYDRITHTSDYFDLIIDHARQMLKDDKAYIDNTPVAQMREWRMLGTSSPSRTQSVQENLRMFQEMIEGTEEGIQCCMRAKIDMSHANKAMRDPTMFRCNLVPHHRTGSVTLLSMCVKSQLMKRNGY